MSGASGCIGNLSTFSVEVVDISESSVSDSQNLIILFGGYENFISSCREGVGGAMVHFQKNLTLKNKRRCYQTSGFLCSHSGRVV